MPKRTKKMKIEDIRRYIEMNIKDVNDITASRIYEVMTGFTASTKEDDGSIRLITLSLIHISEPTRPY